jgi:hypothetical protein
MFKSASIKQAALAAAVALAFGGPAFAANDAHEHGHGAQEAKLATNQGKKWQTDDALRKGMEGIRGALAAELKAIHANKTTPKQYQALAQKIEGEVAGIVQNCKLAPEADAQLHVVIAQLIEGAETMGGKRKGEPRRAGAERVAKALNAYGEHFDHPGWKRI